MKGIINETYYVSYPTNENEMNEHEFELGFSKGDEVEILKVVEAECWLGGKAYVVFNEKTKESMTVASFFVEVI